MKKLCASVIVAVALVSACTTTGDIVSTGNETYSTGSTTRGGFTSWGEVERNTLKRASEFCEAKGKHVETIDVKTHGARGWTPQDVDLKFRCVG